MGEAEKGSSKTLMHVRFVKAMDPLLDPSKAGQDGFPQVVLICHLLAWPKSLDVPFWPR